MVNLICLLVGILFGWAVVSPIVRSLGTMRQRRNPTVGLHPVRPTQPIPRPPSMTVNRPPNGRIVVTEEVTPRGDVAHWLTREKPPCEGRVVWTQSVEHRTDMTL